MFSEYASSVTSYKVSRFEIDISVSYKDSMLKRFTIPIVVYEDSLKYYAELEIDSSPAWIKIYDRVGMYNMYTISIDFLNEVFGKVVEDLTRYVVLCESLSKIFKE